jgi:hypothetical protein
MRWSDPGPRRFDLHTSNWTRPSAGRSSSSRTGSGFPIGPYVPRLRCLWTHSPRKHGTGNWKRSGTPESTCGSRPSTIPTTGLGWSESPLGPPHDQISLASAPASMTQPHSQAMGWASISKPSSTRCRATPVLVDRLPATMSLGWKRRPQASREPARRSWQREGFRGGYRADLQVRSRALFRGRHPYRGSAARRVRQRRHGHPGGCSGRAGWNVRPASSRPRSAHLRRTSTVGR